MHHPTVSDPNDIVHASVTEIVTEKPNFTWHIILYCFLKKRIKFKKFKKFKLSTENWTGF